MPILSKLAHHLITTQAVSQLSLAGLEKLAKADSAYFLNVLSAL
jgi:hypothetical protein